MSVKVLNRRQKPEKEEEGGVAADGARVGDCLELAVIE
jgi:hypothetical protein